MRVIIQEVALRRCNAPDKLYFVQSLPTIDAVPVVRCKNCISFGKQPEFLRGVIRPDTGLCMYTGKLVLPYDFCSNAVIYDEPPASEEAKKE